MQEKIIGKSDIMIGVPCEVDTRTSGKYETIIAKLYATSLKNENFADLKKHDTVYVLTEKEHQELLDKLTKWDDVHSQIHESNKDMNKINEDKIADLEKELKTTKKNLEYYENATNTLVDGSDVLVENNETLKKDNNAVYKTNDMLNDALLGLNATFKETSEDLQSILQSKEKELKETIQNQQLHIDKIDSKYQSLLPKSEYIAPRQHYEEIDKLKDKINASENELATIKADNETKLAKLQQELETKHNEDKAQLYVAYNNDLNNYKMQYNQLAISYNQLLEDLQSLTRINTLLNGRHNVIKKDKEKVELLELPSETPNDIIEYIPKE